MEKVWAVMAHKTQVAVYGYERSITSRGRMQLTAGRGECIQNYPTGLEKLFEHGLIPQGEYNAALRWRYVHLTYLQSIQHPDSLSDEVCEDAALAYSRGVKLLESKGRRVFHAVSSVATYEDNELGDPEYTLAAARVGFAALAAGF